MLRIFRYGAFSLSPAQIARFSHSLFGWPLSFPAFVLTVRTPSRASSLPQGFVVHIRFDSHRKNCGSELARDDGLTDTNHLYAKTRHENVVDRIVRPLTVRFPAEFVRLLAIFASASHKVAAR